MTGTFASTWLARLQARWPHNECRILFHGTAHTFEAFTEDSIGRGSDANSALGIHLAEWAHAAAEYAETSAERDADGAVGRVLVVALPALHPTGELNDFFRFFGEPDDARDGAPALEAQDHAHFARERQRLIAAGHDVVDYEDGEQVISVALNPNDLMIVGELNPAVAESLFEQIEAMEDPFDPAARLQLLAALDEGWTPWPVPGERPIPSRRPARGLR